MRVSSRADKAICLILADSVLLVASVAGSCGIQTIEFVVPARACSVCVALLIAHIDASAQTAVSTVPLALCLIVLCITSHISDPTLNASFGIYSTNKKE
jgi:hypothetical protein